MNKLIERIEILEEWLFKNGNSDYPIDELKEIQAELIIKNAIYTKLKIEINEFRRKTSYLV